MPPDRQPDKASEIRAHTRTKMIHGVSRSRRWDYAHHVVPPISSSAAFRLDTVERGAQGFVDFAHDSTEAHDPIYIYDRLDEPTRGMLEDNLAVAEGGEAALCFSSGMAAISGMLGCLLQAGDQIVTHHVLYGCTYSLLTNWLPRSGVQIAFQDLTRTDQLARAINAKTRVVYFETPVNPDLTLIDIQAVREVVEHFNRNRSEADRVWIIVDNTFATPFCQRPIQHGADIVCHSLTKGIGGFGTDVGGAVIAPNSLKNRLLMYRKDFGGILSPKAAWATLVYGLPSLATRMVNYQKAAHHVARHLSQHPKVEKVLYPGLECFPQFALAKKQMTDPKGHFAPGSMLYFILKDASADGRIGARFVDDIASNAYSISLAVSLGQVKTLIECPFYMTHSALPPEEMKRRGIVPGGIRLSCGLEEWEDIVSDLEDALDAV
jgi:cystathionine beta-lyase/cystathionine gamma-synthase